MKMITVVCAGCHIEFEKPKKEVTRQNKKGNTNFWCTLNCLAKHKTYKNVSQHWGKHNDNLKKGSSCDEYSCFRPIMKNIRYRYSKKKYGSDMNLTLEHLKELWEKQSGKCVYTGVDLVLKPYKDGCVDNPNYTASLDRIDSNLGYSIGNVQFVSLTLNWLKNSKDEKHIQEFFEIIRNCCGDVLVSITGEV